MHCAPLDINVRNEGLRHDRIMEQVLAMPGIEERWESEEVERKALVADPKFILRKKIEGRLQAKHPDKWLPLYSQVKFSDIGYKTAWDEGLRHDRIMEQVLALPNIEEQWESEAVERKVLEFLEFVR